MKKIYLFLFLIAFSLISYGQAPIVTVDRANITGPTNTGVTANISAIGFTRGAGINSNGGGDFSTRAWGAASQAAANTANEYIQWSVSANTGYDIDINSLDIRLLRNNNGPQNWQIFYSLDGFATAGLPYSTSQLATTVETNYNVVNPVINSTDGGTFTFRLYAWNANNNGGAFTIAGDPAWSAFTIADPGTRMSGTVNGIPLNSTDSNIVVTGFNPTDNINYVSFNAASGLTTGNAIKIGEFSIQDGGNDAPDTDLLPTILTDITFDVTGFDNIAALAIFDNTTNDNVSEATSISSSILFSAINSGVGISAPDDGTKTFSVYATFKTAVTDNDQLQLLITNAIADGITGSAFLNTNAGGASTPIVLDDNRIEVTASVVVFDQQPSDVSQLEIMTPFPTVNAVDANGNLDEDYFGLVQVGSFGSLDPPSIFYNINNGIGIFDTIQFSQQSTNVQLIVFSTELGSLFSSTFDVFAPILSIAIQDFDNTSPEWTYTNDIPFFDNGWGTDGYYGIIDVSNAAPLNNPFFSNNILGANDLNDEGNGTAGLATVTFDPVDISAFSNVSLSFDYDITGYGNNDDALYEVFFDGISQGVVDLSNGGPDAEGTVNIAIPDTVNTIGLQVSIGNNGISTFVGFDNFLVASVFDGLIYTNSAWIPNPPDNTTGAQDAFVKDGNYIVGPGVELNNLFIENGATVTIVPSQTLILNNDLVSDGTLVLNSVSTSYSSLIIQGQSTGNVTYNRFVNKNQSIGGNDLITAPVTGQTFGEFANNPDLFFNPSNITEKLFGPFDKVTDTYLTYDAGIPAEAAITLEPAVGYRAATISGSTLEFVGIVNTDIININIVDSGPTNPEWNLIGNPYPSYIELSSFLALNNAAFDPASSGVYGYDGDASDGYNIWNEAYSLANPNAVITPGQGFLMASISGGATVSFTPAMRSAGTTDDFIPGRTTPIEHIKLELSSPNAIYKTDLYFTDEASLGLDPGYDSKVFGGTAPGFSIYSHLIEDNSGDDIGVQSIGYTEYTEAIIPLGINAMQGEEVSISILESSFPDSVNVYLEDLTNNTLTLLNGSNFSFTPDTAISGTGRFFLRFSENSLSQSESALNNLQVFATVNPKALFIKGNLTDITTVKIFDLQGRLIMSSSLDVNSNNNMVDVSKLSTGIYAVSVSSKSLTKTKKIIIK